MTDHDSESCPDCQVHLLMRNINPVSEHEAMRFNTGKPMLSFVLEMPNACIGLAEVSKFGAIKYARGNWRKGFPQMSIVDSLMRHLQAYINGEDIDPESGLPHLYHVHWNSAALIENSVRHPDNDDRLKD